MTHCKRSDDDDDDDESMSCKDDNEPSLHPYFAADVITDSRSMYLSQRALTYLTIPWYVRGEASLPMDVKIKTEIVCIKSVCVGSRNSYTKAIAALFIRPTPVEAFDFVKRHQNAGSQQQKSSALWNVRWSARESESGRLNCISGNVIWRAASLLFGYVVAVAVGPNVHFEMHIVFNKFAERKSIYTHTRHSEAGRRVDGDRRHSHAYDERTYDCRIHIISLEVCRRSISISRPHTSFMGSSHRTDPVCSRNFTANYPVIHIILWFRAAILLTLAFSKCTITRAAPLAGWPPAHLVSVVVIYHKYFPNDT